MHSITQDRTKITEYAKKYYDLGLSIIPVSTEKTPLIEWKKYQKERPRLSEIATWFNSSFFTGAGIAIVTGEVSGVVVVDFDGEEGLAMMKKLEIGETPIAKTGKGYHVYYKHPGFTCRNFARKRPGMDFRGDGGCAVAPPSLHPSGKYYEWIKAPWEVDFAPCPDWLIEMLNERPKGIADGNQEDVIPEGQRNVFLTSLAGSMRRRGMAPEAIAAALKVENQNRCYPPLPDREVEEIAKSIGRYEPEPGALPIDTTPNPTDLGNAMRLVALHGKDLRYCYTWGKWLIWDGKRWVIDDAGQVELLAKDTVKNIYAEAAREASESRRKELAKWALSSESRQRLSAMIALAQSEPGIPIKHDEPNRDRWLINCLNGTLDLRTGELKSHDRADLITKIAPVEYKPGAPCPNWLEFLDMIFEGNQDLIAFVQRAVGYSLTGITDERCMFILWGNGKNGKSTFLETIGRMMGDYAEKTTAETLLTTRQANIPNDIARLQGARFVRASESEHGRYLAEARIKEMTGQDAVSARFLFSEWFNFVPEFKIWLGTNHKPVIRGTDEAIWDRIKLIPFTVRIDNPKPRREIDAIFDEEMAGIFSWAVEGCIEWQEHGLGVAEEVVKATAEYRYEMDNIGRFIEECCEVGEGFRTPSSELYEVYKAWAEDVGVEVLSSQSFGRRLTELGFESQQSKTGKRRWMRQGIRIKDD